MTKAPHIKNEKVLKIKATSPETSAWASVTANMEMTGASAIAMTHLALWDRRRLARDI
jgi:hypothetical protein